MEEKQKIRWWIDGTTTKIRNLHCCCPTQSLTLPSCQTYGFPQFSYPLCNPKINPSLCHLCYCNFFISRTSFSSVLLFSVQNAVRLLLLGFSQFCSFLVFVSCPCTISLQSFVSCYVLLLPSVINFCSMIIGSWLLS